jgi:hypothetical protein
MLLLALRDAAFDPFEEEAEAQECAEGLDALGLA